MQFEVYRSLFSARGDAKTRAMFDAIIEDEKGHERKLKPDADVDVVVEADRDATLPKAQSSKK